MIHSNHAYDREFPWHSFMLNSVSKISVVISKFHCSFIYLLLFLKFCLENSCLYFWTVSSSAKLHEVKIQWEVLVTDEAAQLKECESPPHYSHWGWAATSCSG